MGREIRAGQTRETLGETFIISHSHLYGQIRVPSRSYGRKIFRSKSLHGKDKRERKLALARGNILRGRERFYTLIASEKKFRRRDKLGDAEI